MYVTRTRLYEIDSLDPEPGIIALAAAAIRDGRLVAFPTETVYGLGADATDSDAVARIFAAKQRPFNDPIIVHIAMLRQLDQIAVDIPESARWLAENFWAGALTMVLQRHGYIPSNVSAGMPTVAVRMPSHPVAVALIMAAGVPIAAPSANLFSRPSATTAQHVMADLNGHVDIVLDGGATRIGLESTVIDLSGGVPTILRPGGISVEAIRAVLPTVQVVSRALQPDAHDARSPGEMIKHYAPSTPLKLYSGKVDGVLIAMRSEIASQHTDGRKVGVLTADEERDEFPDADEIVLLGSRNNLAEIGAGLFAHLRTMDQRRVDVMLIRGFGRVGLGAAIWDRLVRAAEGRIIEV